MDGQHHVVIVGGGFAGLYAAKALGRSGCRVTLLDKRNFQLFQPLLYQVATGAIPPGDIAIPHRVVLRKYRNVTCLTSAVFELDPQARVLRHQYGTLRYDTLIVATGVKHHYFGRDSWAQFAPGLKTVEHALDIRRRIFDAFEKAEALEDPVERQRLMSFVIVGAGPTGVELAGAIGELAHKTMVHDFRRIDPRQARILLVEGAPDVLPAYDVRLRRAARRHLEELGVTVRTGTKVEELGPDFVCMRSGTEVETVQAATILWAAGVRASYFGEILAERTGALLDRSGRVKVRPDCSLPGHPEIFVIGDLACLTDARGRDVPGLAPAAIQQGRYVADVIRRRLRGQAPRAPFRYRDLGTMAVIGMNKAVGDLRVVKLTGIAAWLIWAFVHIASLIDAEQRMRVFLQWAWKYCTRKEGDRLITGAPPKTRALRQAHHSRADGGHLDRAA
ncbi:NADH dehydrogenase [Fontimonas thermophila]|uniref:NADH:ubiquinone reductase (non-electrogenic) n=1 Tax=Fontimonas thermophila TaxID=1076937 RepID=A0A1I2H198_9GAMM|nr:NAD(P)/FAD-dependent oxidoreductase [Fontimonas thermophila]SFF22511.1 NADH dehydrogenase [Fontimonas thermophila]